MNTLTTNQEYLPQAPDLTDFIQEFNATRIRAGSHATLHCEGDTNFQVLPETEPAHYVAYFRSSAAGAIANFPELRSNSSGAQFHDYRCLFIPIN